MEEQQKKLTYLQNKMTENLNKLLERWNITDDKNLYSQDLLQDVPKILQDYETLQSKVEKGEFSDSILEQLNILNKNLVETTIKIEWDTNRIYTEQIQEKVKERITKKLN